MKIVTSDKAKEKMAESVLNQAIAQGIISAAVPFFKKAQEAESEAWIQFFRDNPTLPAKTNYVFLEGKQEFYAKD